MSKIRPFDSCHQVIVYLILAYLISWSTVIPMNGSILPHGPMFAAFIVVGIVVGRRGTSELWRQMTNWRMNWKWFLMETEASM